MVHALRNRKVCDTSPESNASLDGTRFNFVYPPNDHNNNILTSSNYFHTPFATFENPELQSTRIEPIPKIIIQHNTPTESSKSTDIRKSSDNRSDISRIEGVEQPFETNFSDISSTDEHNFSSVESENSSQFQKTLGLCINQVIFERTFKKIGGISLHAIKKTLNNEFGYDTFHYRKSICVYVRESLVNGRLKQVSGRGAAGSVRLNVNSHRSFTRELHKANSGVVKAKNRKNVLTNTTRSILHTTSVVLNRFKNQQRKLTNKCV